MNSACFERRDPSRRVRSRRREVLPVGAELAERPVLGDRCGGTRPSVRLERADHQPAGVVASVEGPVESAHQREKIVRALDRFGRDVDVLGRVKRNRDADGRGEVAGPQAARENDRLGLDVAPVGAHAGHGAVLGQQVGDAHTLPDRHATVVRALREGERRVPRVHGPVAGLKERAHEAVGGDERPHLGDLSGFEQTGLDPVVTGDRGRVPELRHPALVLGERERARRPEVHVDARLLGEPPVEVDAVVRELGHRVRAANARDEPGGVPRGARRDPRLVRGAARP